MATTHTFPGSPFQRALAAGVQANVPTGVIGEPGQGKTETMESSTSGWGRHCETVIGSNREATDFLGVMIEDEGAIRTRVHHLAPIYRHEPRSAVAIYARISQDRTAKNSVSRADRVVQD